MLLTLLCQSFSLVLKHQNVLFRRLPNQLINHVRKYKADHWFYFFLLMEDMWEKDQIIVGSLCRSSYKSEFQKMWTGLKAFCAVQFTLKIFLMFTKGAFETLLELMEGVTLAGNHYSSAWKHTYCAYWLHI